MPCATQGTRIHGKIMHLEADQRHHSGQLGFSLHLVHPHCVRKWRRQSHKSYRSEVQALSPFTGMHEHTGTPWKRASPSGPLPSHLHTPLSFL